MPVTSTKMPYRKRLAACLVIAGLIVGVAAPAPAHAATFSLSCRATQYVFFEWYLYATASYYTVSPGEHVWTDYTYRLDGGGTGDESNVNINFFEAYGQVDRWASEDNRRSYVNYSLHYVVPTYGFTDDHNDERVSMEAIFDIAGPDPRCTAWTPSV